MVRVIYRDNCAYIYGEDFKERELVDKMNELSRTGWESVSDGGYTMDPMGTMVAVMKRPSI